MPAADAFDAGDADQHRPGTGGPRPAPGPDTVAPFPQDLATGETVARLMAEFAVDLPTVTRVVGACCRDLHGAPHAALPELIERLAREDLADIVAVSRDTARPGVAHRTSGPNPARGVDRPCASSSPEPAATSVPPCCGG